MTAKEGRSPRLAYGHYGRMAFEAALTLASIDIELMLEIAFLAGNMQKVAQGRTAGDNGIL